jgi:hypothetical protein
VDDWPHIAYGGDYSRAQWPEDVHADDQAIDGSLKLRPGAVAVVREQASP